jgi:hypothetical protein
MGGTETQNIISHNAPHLEILGWLRSEKILEVKKTGEYEIQSLDRDVPGIKQLKIKSPKHGYYFVSLRSPRTDLDAINEQIPGFYFQGVTVHTLKKGFTDHEANPSPDNERQTLQLGVVKVGNKFENDSEKISIELKSLKDNVAKVFVSVPDAKVLGAITALSSQTVWGWICQTDRIPRVAIKTGGRTFGKAATKILPANEHCSKPRYFRFNRAIKGAVSLYLRPISGPDIFIEEKSL